MVMMMTPNLQTCTALEASVCTVPLQLGAKAVAKAYPEEKVGVFAERSGALAVLEYSELDPSVASAEDPDRYVCKGEKQESSRLVHWVHGAFGNAVI